MRLIEINHSDIKPGDRIRAVEKRERNTQGSWVVEYLDLVGVPRYEYTEDQLRAVESIKWWLVKDDLPQVCGAVIRIGTRAAVFDGLDWYWADDLGVPVSFGDLNDAEVLFVPGKL